MNKVEFEYYSVKTIIQCNAEDKMKDIINKFLNKIGKKKKNIYFLYNGQIMNEELTFNKCANNLDKSRNCMTVIILEVQGSDDDLQCMKKSNYIICPECKENSLITIEDYKIRIYGCKNGHITDNIKIKDFEKTQYIDQSIISCDNCKTLKSETNENKFYKCFKCKQNICPLCKKNHDKSHNLIDYEEYINYCNTHFDAYKYYCSDCNKDICTSCENEHKDHNLISYGSIMPDINSMKNELTDTKEKILKLKAIINDIMFKLNNLNKNLDNYFEIYYNLISNFDINKKNYYSIKCINDMKQYNNNFIISITEISNDNNFKTQYNEIITIENKMENDGKNNNSLNENKDKEEKYNNKDNKIIENDNIDDKNENEDNIQEYNPLDDKYENLKVDQIKEYYSFSTKYKITKLLILKDRRILTIQNHINEKGTKLSKLIIYNTKNGFICDINHDFKEEVKDVFEMDSGNLIMHSNKIKIIKLKKNTIFEIFSLDEWAFLIFKFDNYNIAIIKDYIIYSDKIIFYIYENNKLSKNLDIQFDYHKEKIYSLCKINEEEIAISLVKNGMMSKSNLIIFYDIKKNQKIKSLKVGRGYNKKEIYLINKDNILVGGEEGEKKFILIDVKKKNIFKEIKTQQTFFKDYDIIYLSDNSFLITYDDSIYQYQFNNSNLIIVAQKRISFNIKVLKYPDNKLICVKSSNKITIYE